MTATAKQLAAFQARLDRQEKEAQRAAEMLAVAQLSARLALKGRRPTRAEENEARTAARKRRETAKARERMAEADAANRVPANRRIR